MVENASPHAIVLGVQILSGPDAAPPLLFTDADRIRIGRHPDCEIRFSDQEPEVSFQHAEVRRAPDGFVLHPCQGRDGSFLLPSGERAATVPIPIGTPVEVRLGVDGPRLLLLARCELPSLHDPTPAAGPAPPPLRPPGPPPLPPPPSPPAPPGPAVPFGRYVLTGVIGAGGMARLYLAHLSGLGGFRKQLALKLIHPHMYENSRVAAMFLDEASIAARISHPNVIQIHEVGSERGLLYIAMEYLPGTSLAALMTQLARKGQPLPPDLCAALVLCACEGLHAAHELRAESGRPLDVVHRDISPSNLLCLREGIVKVIDFGLARASERTSEGTLVGTILGNPPYMSPEQTYGGSRPVDRRSDLFSTAVVLYELCTLRPLFKRDSVHATMDAVRNAPIEPLRALRGDVPDALSDLLRRALDRDPDRRPRTAAEFAAVLRQIVAQAGGRFFDNAAIAAYFLDRGVRLAPQPPQPITGQTMPWPAETLPPGAPPRQPAPPPAPPPPSPLIDHRAGGDVVVPAQGQVLRLRTQARSEILVATLELNHRFRRGPLPLPLLADPGVLPAPLQVLLTATNPEIEVPLSAPSLGGKRPHLYSGRSLLGERCHLRQGVTGESFDVGHSKVKLQTVCWCSTAPDAPRPALHLTDLDLRLSAPGAPRQLVALHTTGPESGTTYLVCILVT